jgi:hypothetical protein
MTETVQPPQTGPLSTPFAKLATMIANSPTYQARVGVTDDPNAADRCLEKIRWPVLEPGEDVRNFFPAIVLVMEDRFQFAEVSGGGQNYLRPSGSIGLLIAEKTAFDGSRRAGFIDILNYIGGLLSDLAAVAGQSSQLSIVGIRQVIPPGLCSLAEEASGPGPYFEAAYAVDWN